jgi:hypothetical protein
MLMSVAERVRLSLRTLAMYLSVLESLRPLNTLYQIQLTTGEIGNALDIPVVLAVRLRKPDVQGVMKSERE